MRRIRRFLQWPNAKKQVLLRAFMIVVVVRIGLWCLPYKRLLSLLPSIRPTHNAITNDWKLINESIASVRLCSRFVPRATCLTQALATQVLLCRHGQASNLRIGVQRDSEKQFLAHAWVEVEGKIIIGKLQDIHRFTVLIPSPGRPV